MLPGVDESAELFKVRRMMGSQNPPLWSQQFNNDFHGQMFAEMQETEEACRHAV